MHSVHRLSPFETLCLCPSPDRESIEIAGTSAQLVTACSAQSTNQRGDNLMHKDFSPIRHFIRSQEKA